MERSFVPFSGCPSSDILQHVVQHHGLDAGMGTVRHSASFTTGSLVPSQSILTSLLALPSALPAIGLFSISKILSFQECYINGIAYMVLIVFTLGSGDGGKQKGTDGDQREYALLEMRAFRTLENEESRNCWSRPHRVWQAEFRRRLDMMTRRTSGNKVCPPDTPYL
ncbi:uncharacterized protein LOC107195453 isoform X2 [Pteropus alecto]|uniref:uncharacterized protein LOC107195453 isoform X2 n=1 Tax=Pteropus alecto TaxID=9402 RepID=UPI000D5351FB|nr:uncharacterized protein LOC107195453 isoform X2 [Pteropus alecto]